MLLAAGCAGGAENTSPAHSPNPTPTSAPKPTTSAPAAKTAADSHHDDVPEASKPTDAQKSSSPAPLPAGINPLQLLMPNPSAGLPTDFPKSVVTDKECHKTVGLIGKQDVDFTSLAKACGTDTGMKEYVKHISGKFDGNHHQDTFLMNMAGGYCYRFFAVGEPNMGKLAIRVHRPNGALLSIAESKQAIVLMDPNEPWCKRHDRDFHIVVASESGQGAYTFGIWARPNPKGRATD